MTKGQLMACIITKLRGKQHKYTIEQIINSLTNEHSTNSDREKVKNALFSLKEKQILKESTDGGIDEDAVFYYALSPFYRQYLVKAHQTDSVKECYQILFPEGDKELVQGDLFKL